MAIREAKEQIGKLFETGYKTLSKMTFYMDSVEDLASLPDDDGCLAGSKAIDLETGDMYLMSPSGVWYRIVGGGSGSTSSQPVGGGTEYIQTVLISGENGSTGSLNVSFNDINEMIEQKILPVFIITIEPDEMSTWESSSYHHLRRLEMDPSTPTYRAVLVDVPFMFEATSPDATLVYEMEDQGDSEQSGEK